MIAEHKLNEQIRAREVRLIGADGNPIGVMSAREALFRADEVGLDLVEIAPTATPPVCKIMDYGKFKYQEQKKSHEAKMKQHRVETKEIHIRPATDEGDYKVKIKKVREFLTDGDKCRIVLKFIGREVSYVSQGNSVLDRIAADTADIGNVEQRSGLEVKKLIMTLAPKPKKV